MMTEQANKQIVRDFLVALGRGDVEGLAPILARDVKAVATGTCFLSGTRDYDTILLTAGTLESIVKGAPFSRSCR